MSDAPSGPAPLDAPAIEGDVPPATTSRASAAAAPVVPPPHGEPANANGASPETTPSTLVSPEPAPVPHDGPATDGVAPPGETSSASASAEPGSPAPRPSEPFSPAASDGESASPEPLSSGPAPPSASTSPGSGAPPAEPAAVPAPAAMPREPAVLGGWLGAQPLAPFVYGDSRVSRVGRDDAPLLVVVERAVPGEAPPLAGEAAALFERMLGAIGLSRRATCQCALASDPRPGEGDTVGALGSPARRATLVLLQSLDGALDADGCRLEGSGLGRAAWMLPHPDLLLAEPARKAQAWQVLKALRRHLRTRGP